MTHAINKQAEVKSKAVLHFIENGFKAYNNSPNPYLGHGLPSTMYGPEPQIKTGYMLWQAPEGVTGIVPLKKNGKRMKTQDLYGVRIADLMTNAKRHKVTDNFNIAYTIMWPAGVDINSEDIKKYPLIGMLHGVPMNRRAKYKVMRHLARHAVCVCWDMLGMGESDMPLQYGTKESNQATIKPGKDPVEFYKKFNRQWDWKHDLDYVHQLMTEYIPLKMGMDPKEGWIFQADDWGTGIAMSYASDAEKTKTLRMLFLLNAVMLDGYFVIEIGTIGKMAEIHARAPQAYSGLAPILPQLIVGIEKYMVSNRKRMNRYTESDYLFPYINTNYQAGNMAANMHHSEWALLLLANRSSRLAPRQLQPFHRNQNIYGIKTWMMRAPVHFIWGENDQMMPPSQIDRGMYLWPASVHTAATIVANADHFVEIDQPERVFKIMVRAINGTLGLGTTPTMMGITGDGVTYKGDEREIATDLDKIYRLHHQQAPMIAAKQKAPWGHTKKGSSGPPLKKDVENYYFY